MQSRLGLALLGAAVVVLAAAAAGAYLALRGDDSAAMPSDGGSMSMGTGTIIGELIDPHLPSAVMETCERTKPLTDDFLRTVRCSAPRGITVTYSRAHGGEALRGYFDHELASHVGDRFPTATTCRARGGSATTWVRDGDFGHIEGPGGDTAASAVKGRVLCYARAGKAWLEWTDTPTKLYAVASAPAAARGRLYAWWADGAGPGEATGHGAGMEQLGAYPDEVERELLLAHMPAPDRCRRGEIPDREVFLRTIVCKQGDTDLEATYSVAHGTDELRSYLQRRILRTGIADPGRPSGECRKYTPAYQFWKRPDGNRKRITSLRSGSTGGIVCYHDAQTGRPTLEWTDNPRQIFAQASRGLGDEALLYSWWQRQSGPEQERSMEADSGADHMG